MHVSRSFFSREQKSFQDGVGFKRKAFVFSSGCSVMATLLQLSRFAVQTSVYVSQPAKINRKCDVTLISRARLPQTFFSQLSMVVNLLGAILHPVARELLNSTWNHSQFKFKPWMQSGVVPTVWFPLEKSSFPTTKVPLFKINIILNVFKSLF